MYEYAYLEVQIYDWKKIMGRKVQGISVQEPS
jgi:hypothetical protein